MKILSYLMAIFTIFLFAAPSSLLAVSWKTANQVTFAWDASETADIPQEQISYTVLMVSETDTTKASPTTVVENLTALQHTITMNVEGRYFLGVKAVRTVDGAVVSESTVAWSDDDAATGSKPFGVQFYKTPDPPGGLGTK
jgi:hypothetical protein